ETGFFGNDTYISEFLLLGISNEPELQPLIFGLFLTMYLITVFGNLLLILAVSSDSHLNTPMYFFLSNLSFVDICFISTTIPKMLWNIQMQSKVITYEGCISQIYFLLLFAGLDDFLLTVMAYDRFVAICHPLHYTDPELQSIISGLFLSMYLITVFGNLLIILAITSDAHLHTPMYFFLSNLSFVDIYICFTSTTIPKMLWNIWTQSKVISYKECITQIYFLILFAVLDILLLTVMAYDRFVAICQPLHYTVIMNPQLCGLLVLMSWIISVLNSLSQSLMVLRLSFCTNIEIPHFFCELNHMVQLACSDTFLNNIVMYFAAVLLCGGPFFGILCSYSKIVSSICRISSAQGKYKAFSTCASHLTIVSLFYCTMLGVYLSSAATHNAHSSATASVMYTVITPMLNPFIYSLRNKDMKRALKALFVKGNI
uniref:G-protein coupled receptors family 1 profile domain-containing protein n=1 Tax=Moschus moschiferus TaxID=68415 RepID=A0A8C6E7S2_MOSMO